MEVEFSATPRETTGENESKTPSGDRFFHMMVNTGYQYAATITPSANLLLGGYCDALVLAADGTVTITPADDPTATPVAFALKGGMPWPMAAAKITACTTTVVAFWRRKPKP